MISREEAEAEEQRQPGEGDDEMIDEAEMAEEDDFDDKEHIGVAAMDEDKQIIHSAVNENDWKLECERVANKLKVQSKQDTKEWRAHIDSTKHCIDSIKKRYSSLYPVSPTPAECSRRSTKTSPAPSRRSRSPRK